MLGQSAGYDVGMSMTATLPTPDATDRIDGRVFLRDVAWNDYEHMLVTRGERRSPLIAFWRGVIELMAPSHPHEQLKSHLGALIELWCLHHDIEVMSRGSWTLKMPPLGGVEPDECYVLGSEHKPVPDLVIEVVWTHGALEKLPIYRALGVPEVWVWQNGALAVHVLDDLGYVPSDVSRAFPGLDVAFVASLLDRPTLLQAQRALLDSLAG